MRHSFRQRRIHRGDRLRATPGAGVTVSCDRNRSCERRSVRGRKTLIASCALVEKGKGAVSEFDIKSAVGFDVPPIVSGCVTTIYLADKFDPLVYYNRIVMPYHETRGLSILQFCKGNIDLLSGPIPCDFACTWPDMPRDLSDRLGRLQIGYIHYGCAVSISLRNDGGAYSPAFSGAILG